MWGVQCMHNFGKVVSPHETPDETTRSRSKPKRVDEEDAMEGGLKGRISAGTEFYFSAKEKSAGGTNWYEPCFAVGFAHRFNQCLLDSDSLHYQTQPHLPPSFLQNPKNPRHSPHRYLSHRQPSLPSSTR